MRRLAQAPAPLAGTLAALAALVLLLGGCAGTPRGQEEGLSPKEISALFARAEGLLELGTPQSLEEAAALMQRPGLPQERALESAALAGELYRLLFARLEVPAVFPPAGTYRGAFRELLAAAARGEPPLPREREAEASFLDRVLPALYLQRLPWSLEEGFTGEFAPGTGASTPGTGASTPGLQSLAAALEAARNQNPGSALPPYFLGILSERIGETQAARRLYGESLARADSFYPAREHLAGLYLRAGGLQEAAAELERLRRLLPADDGLRRTLIDTYLHAERPAEAADLTAQALIERPDEPAYLLLRARILLREGDWAQALKPLNLLVLTHPEVREGYLLMARIQNEQAGDAEAALEALAEGEAAFPRDPEFPELAGAILLAAGREEEGVDSLKRALELEPGRTSTLRLLVSQAMEARRWLQAARYLEELLEKEDGSADLARAHLIFRQLGDPARALVYSERWYRREGGGPALAAYATDLLDDGRLEEARALVAAGLQGQPEAPVRSTLLALQARLLPPEQGEEALRTLQQALILDPENREAVRALGELYLLRGELRRARLFLRQAVRQNPGDAALAARLGRLEEELSGAAGGEPPAP